MVTAKKADSKVTKTSAASRTTRKTKAAIRPVVGQIPIEYIDCRTVQHAWKYTTVEKKGRRILVQGFRCTRCETVKHQDIDARNGDILKTDYLYHKDYLISGLGVMTAAERGSIRLRAALQHMQTIADADVT